MTPGSRRGASKTALPTQQPGEHPSPLPRMSLSVGGQGTVLEQNRSTWSPLLWSLRATRAARIAAKALWEPLQPHQPAPDEPLELQPGNPHTAQESTDKLCPFYHCVGLIWAFVLIVNVSMERNKNISRLLQQLQAAHTACLTPPLVGMFRHYQTSLAIYTSGKEILF